MQADPSWSTALDLFGVADAAARQALVDGADIRRLGVGTTVIAQDAEDDQVFLLLDGAVRVVLLSEAGQEIWLDGFGPGTVFGEMAALTGSARTSEIVAEADCRLAVYNRGTFFELLQRHGPIGLALAKVLAQRVHNTTQRMFELSALSAPGRIYAELLRMSAPPANGAAQRIIAPAPSMTELARRVNTTRETASRTVNGLERRGLLRRGGKRLELVDPDLLSRMSGSA